MKLIPKYKGGNQVKFKYRLGYDPELNTVRTAFVDIPEVVVTPDTNDYRRLALDRSRRATSPTVSFDNAIDLWCVADNIRIGAALNTVRIAKRVIEMQLF